MTLFAILSADGMVNGPLAVTLDILATAKMLAPGSELDARIFATPSVHLNGHSLGSAQPLAKTKEWPADAVIIPGLGLAYAQSPEDLLHADLGRTFQRIVLDAHERGAWIAASCTGAFVPAEVGLLNGGPATTSWWLAPRFRATYPAVLLDEGQLTREHGRILTGGGALAHIELMLLLLRKFLDAELVEAIARFLVSPRRGPQAANASTAHMPMTDPIVAAFICHLQGKLDVPVSVADIASALGTTPRTLERRVRKSFGTTPIGVAQRMRAETAMHLLRTTQQPLKVICEQVGYQDENSLRQLLLRTTGLTPRSIRALG